MSSLPIQSQASPVATPQEGSPSAPPPGQAGSFGDAAASSPRINTSMQPLHSTSDTEHLSEIDGVESDGVESDGGESDGVDPEIVALMKQNQQARVEDLHKKVEELQTNIDELKKAANSELTTESTGSAGQVLDIQAFVKDLQVKLNQFKVALKIAQNWYQQDN